MNTTSENMRKIVHAIFALRTKACNEMTDEALDATDEEFDALERRYRAIGKAEDIVMYEYNWVCNRESQGIKINYTATLEKLMNEISKKVSYHKDDKEGTQKGYAEVLQILCGAWIINMKSPE